MKRKSLFFLLAMSLLTILPLTVYAIIPQIEREALIAIYNSTDGDQWRNNDQWKSPPLHTDGFSMPGTEKNWKGIRIDSSDTHIEGLNLVFNQLSGIIPSEIGDFTKLIYLNLSENDLSGIIPPEIGDFTKLIYLNLSENNLSGNIPPEIGNLTELTFFVDLSENDLSGNIPSEIGNLTSLELLKLSSNQLSGIIPPEIGNLIHLSELDLSSNQLSGIIPPEIGNLIHLSDLDVSSNQLSGSIPSGIGNLTSLDILKLSLNQLSGTIPPEIGKLTLLSDLDLSSNQLSGIIPPEIGNLYFNHEGCSFNVNNCTNLMHCPQHDCEPFTTFYSLNDLDLSSNQLSGIIPPEMGNLTNLNRLNLSSNQLSGSIPPEMGNLTNLNRLNLSSNQLSGSIPSYSGRPLPTKPTTVALSREQASSEAPIYFDGETFTLNIPAYASPVDVYFALLTSSNELLFIGSNEDLTFDFAPYVIGAVNSEITTSFSMKDSSFFMPGLAENGVVYWLIVPSTGENLATLKWDKYELGWYGL